ncbi:MAG: hypothetical protein QW390_03285, partial [Candidatus Bathyarchaeia archaeon]
SGMDARAVHERFGEKLFLAGNIDKRKVAQGGEAMRREVDAKLALLEEGGYIPGMDHVVPLDVSYPKFAEYAAYIKSRLAG